MWTKKNISPQHGKTAIVTGANTGIGFETALALYEAGAHVVLACRNQDLANQAMTQIKQHEGDGTLETALLDLSSLAAVKQFAEAFIKDHTQLHILINNAGVMIPPASKTADGFELQFGVNFLGHFALAGHLYPLLKATPGARVVSVSSMAYLRVESIDYSNLHIEHSYDAMREYAQSKLANILFANELQRRIVAAGDPVMAVSAQPGANKTELARHMTQEEIAAAVARIGDLMEPWQGALPSLYAAVMPEVTGGDFYSPDQDNGFRGYPAKTTLLPHAQDAAAAKKLWEYAEQATGIKYPDPKG